MSILITNGKKTGWRHTWRTTRHYKATFLSRTMKSGRNFFIAFVFLLVSVNCKESQKLVQWPVPRHRTPTESNTNILKCFSISLNYMNKYMSHIDVMLCLWNSCLIRLHVFDIKPFTFDAYTFLSTAQINEQITKWNRINRSRCHLPMHEVSGLRQFCRLCFFLERNDLWRISASDLSFYVYFIISSCFLIEFPCINCPNTSQLPSPWAFGRGKETSWKTCPSSFLSARLLWSVVCFLSRHPLAFLLFDYSGWTRLGFVKRKEKRERERKWIKSEFPPLGRWLRLSESYR